MVTETDILTMFEAETIFAISRAADQDGYDGGFVARDSEVEAWGPTIETARLNLMREKLKTRNQ